MTDAKKTSWNDEQPWSVCIGCDPNEQKFPIYLKQQYPQHSSIELLALWGRLILQTYAGRCKVIKFQVAWFERYGSRGYSVLEELIDTAHQAQMLVIADIKRGDIGESNKAYAKAWFEHFKVDAVTVNPWLGVKSLTPILTAAAQSGGRVYATLRTSNPESDSLQNSVFHQLATECLALTEFSDTLAYVIGADRRQECKWLLERLPTVNILVPGFGSQAGSTDNLLDFFPKSSYENMQCKNYRVLFSASRSLTGLADSQYRTFTSNDDLQHQLSVSFNEFNTLLADQLPPYGIN